MDAVGSLYEKVKDRVPRAEFDRRLREADAQFGGLLDEEALALLVLDDLGLNEGAYATLSALKGRSEATVRARIDRIDPPRSFERAGRDPGRVVNVVVSDATGETRLVFWDKDTERAEALRPGMHVTIVNARVKEGRSGAELHVGPWSVLEVEGALDPARAKLLADVREGPAEASSPVTASPAGPGAAVQTRLVFDDVPTTIEGVLVWLSVTRPYRTKEGGTGFACDADVETQDGLRRLVAWDAAVKTVRSLPLGSRARISGLDPKVKGAATEWHTTASTRFEAL